MCNYVGADLGQNVKVVMSAVVDTIVRTQLKDMAII
jgi:hypothetical protein